MDNLWSFASAWEALTDERAEVIRQSSIFWSGCGVRKRTKPDLSYVDIFVQPCYWGPWALVCSDGQISTLGSFISPGPLTTRFGRICKLHAHMQVARQKGEVSAHELDVISDKLTRHFLGIAIPFVQSIVLDGSVEDALLLIQPAVKAARSDVLDIFRGDLQPKDLVLQRKKDTKRLLFGRMTASSSDSSGSESDDSAKVTTHHFTKPEATSDGSHAPPKKSSHARARARRRAQAARANVGRLLNPGSRAQAQGAPPRSLADFEVSAQGKGRATKPPGPPATSRKATTPKKPAKKIPVQTAKKSPPPTAKKPPPKKQTSSRSGRK